jgi:hypothetical protein
MPVAEAMNVIKSPFDVMGCETDVLAEGFMLIANNVSNSDCAVWSGRKINE